MNIPASYQQQFVMQWRQMDRDIQRTAWARLWAEGVYFYSQECALKWLNLRQAMQDWEREGDASMVHATALDMDNVVREDEAKEEAAQIARILEEMENNC